MRKVLKFLHTLASCGLIGAILGYAVVLLYAPQETSRSYAEARQTISLLCDYVLLPSLAVAIVSGLLVMAAHRPFFDTRWAWLKALLGLILFEATLAVIQSKATSAADLAAKIAAGKVQAGALAEVIASERTSLIAILLLSIAQIALGIWRPRLAKR
jgi:hypothetical protein